MEPGELQAIRNEAGLSQEEFAARVGLSRVAVELMELGQAPIDQRTVIAAQTLSQGARTNASQRARIDKARALIDRIENHGMRFYACDGSGPMRDVTEEALEAQHADIREAKEIIGLWGGVWR